MNLVQFYFINLSLTLINCILNNKQSSFLHPSNAVCGANVIAGSSAGAAKSKFLRSYVGQFFEHEWSEIKRQVGAWR